jgi:hypothetical protein
MPRKEDYDYTGKRVAVIGNGSSAIQVVPKLQKLVSHLTNLIRSPTWVSPNMNTKFTRGGNGKNFFCKYLCAGWFGRCFISCCAVTDCLVHV